MKMQLSATQERPGGAANSQGAKTGSHMSHPSWTASPVGPSIDCISSQQRPLNQVEDPKQELPSPALSVFLIYKTVSKIK